MSEEVKVIECVGTFKQAVAQLYGLIKPPRYYGLGFKTDNVLHARRRIGLSGLNAHLFRINSFRVHSPYCYCQPFPDGIRHYLFICSKYSLQGGETERSLIIVLTG